MQPFVISLKGLRPGKSHYEWQAGNEFFAAFENSEVLDASINATVDLEYQGDSASLFCALEGFVVVTCDRCLEDLRLEGSTEVELEDDEIDLSRDIDLRQDVYDFVMTSLPMQRTHPDGECNEETVKYLSK